MTSLTQRARSTAHAPSIEKTADWLGTAGWAAKGALYLLIAVIAGQLALSGDTGGEEASKQGAMQRLADQPAGYVLLLLVVIGLFAYAAYRLVSIFLPASGDDGKDKARHLARAGSALVYGVAGAQGAALLLGRQSGGGGGSEQSWSAVLLSSTVGTVVLLAVGIGFLAFAGHQVWYGSTKRFMKKMSVRDGGAGARRTVESVGMTGLLARGVVAALIGIFIVLSVWHRDPNEVRGLDAALRTLQTSTAGPVLLLLVAVGLAAYGLYSLVSARYRRHEAG